MFFFQAEDGIRDLTVTGVQTCALPISKKWASTTHAHFWRASRMVRSQRSNRPVTRADTRLSTRLKSMANTLPSRSEEHTSELQSQSNLVCRLLLEKKKKI